jgi:hypothetical protein
LTRSIVEVAVLVCALSLRAGTARGFPIISGASTGTQTPDVVYKADQIRPFLQAAAARRVDIAGIGDSNQIFGGDYGHDHGFQLAWSNQYGMYASEVLPSNAQGGFGVMGTDYSSGATFASTEDDPALPAAYRNFSLATGGIGCPQGGGFIPAGQRWVQGQAALFVGQQAPFYDATLALKGHSTYYRFPGA